MAPEQILIDLQNFLTSSATTVEWMSDDLRTELSIETGLEKVIESVVSANKSLVIAGTAGSGKTHLIRMAGNLKKFEVVPDLAALPESKWSTLFSQKGPVIIAGNEGAFHAGVSRNIKGFDQVVSALHALQKGEEVSSTAGPVVIDAAGYDPAGSHVIAEMLNRPILAQYVESKGDVVQKAAWQMLQNETVRRRVARLVETASAQSEVDGFTFRQLWQFVSDLIEGGSGIGGLWFHRVFNGDSEVSTKIAETFSPSRLAMPHLGNRFWHLDIEAIREHVFDSCIPIIEFLLQPAERDKTDNDRRARLRIVREFAVFALKRSTFEENLDRPDDLWAQVRGKQHDPLLRAVNRYMTYGLLSLGQDLELWVQHDTERRELKPNVQISLGSVPSEAFQVRRSCVIANRPKGCQQIEGGRLNLVHKPSGAALSLDKDLVDALLRGRSHKTRERRGVEYDWRLLRFFSAVASQAARAEALRVALFQFQTRQGRLVTWQVKGNQIEKLAV